MAFTHGKDAVIQFDNAADSLTDFTQYVTEVGITMNGEAIDVTTLGDTWRDFIGGIKGATITMNGIYDPTVDAALFAAVNTAKSIQWDPQGSGSGLPRFTGEMIITSYNPTSPIGGASTWTASGTVDGTLTRATI